MTLLAFGNRLSAAAWVREVAKLELVAQGATSIGLSSDDESIEIDLSSTRSADFLVLGRLLVLLEVLTARGTRILIRMPSKDLLAAERIYLDRDGDPGNAASGTAVRQIFRHRRQRINCRLFIEQSGFDAALCAGPLKRSAIEIVEGNFGPSPHGQISPPSIEADQYDIPQTPQRRRGIISYRWIDVPESADGTELTDPLFRSIRGLGLAADDATALTRGVLDELIENAKHHGRGPSATHAWVLVGGELTHPQSYSRRIDDFDSYLRNLLIWSSKEPSPLLRLFIGDAGRGIYASLEEKRSITPESNQPNDAAEANTVALEHSRAILTAFDYHATHYNPDREPQGLWKVKRVVRSFQGALLITSGAATAGYIFDASSESEGQEIEVVSPTWLPGTMVECTVLTAPGRDIHPYEEELPSPIPPLASAASNLSCVTALLRPRVGFDTDDLAIIQHNLERLQNVVDGGLVIGVEMPSGTGSPAGSEIEDAIRSVLDIASKAANPATVTLVFSGVSRRLLSVAIDALNRRQDEPESRPPRMHSPILVVSPENIHYWAGGIPLIRQLLAILSKSAESQFKILDLGQSLGVDAPAALERQIRDQPRLVHLDKGTITLRLRPQDAVNSLTQYLSKKLTSSVAAAQAPGVTKGKYLTPSLRVTSRWIDMQILLQHLRCHQMAGFALAEAVKKKAGSFSRSPGPTVVCAGSVDEQLAAVFSLTLSGIAETFENVAALRMSNEHGNDAGNRHITICTDLVSRGASVRRTIRELEDMGFRHVSVATIIDGRDLAYANESRDFLRVRDSQVSITSLARVSLDADLDESDEEPSPIDPVTGTPLKVRYPHSKTVGRQDLYIRAISESGAARLGHISRPGERHYSAYINPSVLFGYEPWSENALQRIVDFIKIDNEQIAPADSSALVAIIYPTEPKNDFSQVVDALADKLRKEEVGCLDPIPIPRSPTGSGWTFPRFAQIPLEASHIVVIDSTSKTGRTLRELIRLASRPETAFITCVGLIHGMNDLAAMSLQQIRRVATYSLNDPLSTTQGTVPVKVRYLVRTAVSGSDAGHCSICVLRHTYTSLPATLPRSMSDHRRRLGELLAARSREEVFEELATDLFGVHITQEDCVAYLEWRSFLEEAAFSTASRASAVEKLSRLAAAIHSGVMDEDKTRERDALIRLIAAEHNRLEQAPMWFTSVRDKLVQVARSVLSAPVSLTSDPMLRVQALIVFARADARVFCSQYADIVRLCKDHETVVTHALLEALVLLSQDWKQAEWRAALVEQISMLSHDLDAESLAESTWDFRAVEELAYLSGLANRERSLPPNSAQQAWSELKRFCDSVKRHRYDQAIWRLQRRLENVERGRLPASPASTFSDWEYCAAALDENVLSNLGLVRDVLTSDESIDGTLPSRDERRRWREIMDGAGRQRLNEISVAVGRVFLGGDPLSMPRDELEDLGETLDRWSKFFFYSTGSSDETDRSALLTRIVNQCPASVLEAVKDVFDGSLWNLELYGIQESDTVSVFCSSSVLTNTLTHIQMNAEVTHRQGGQSPRFQVEVCHIGRDKVEVSIVNDGSSQATRGGGRGLDSVARDLARFGGSLEPIDPLPSGWTYGIRIILERWKWK